MLGTQKDGTWRVFHVEYLKASSIDKTECLLVFTHPDFKIISNEKCEPLVLKAGEARPSILKEQNKETVENITK